MERRRYGERRSSGKRPWRMDRMVEEEDGVDGWEAWQCRWAGACVTSIYISWFSSMVY